MSKQVTLSVLLEQDRIHKLDELAKRWGCSRDQVIATAMLRFVDEEAPLDEIWRTLPLPPPEPGLEVLDKAAEALRAFIQEGVDSADCGELIPHEEVMDELRRKDEEAGRAAKNAA